MQGFEWSEACGDEALQFFMETEAGEDVHAGRSVGSGEERNSTYVELVNNFEFLGDEVFTGGENVGTVTLHDFIGKALPGGVFP